MAGYGFQTTVNVKALRQEYQRVISLTPEQAQVEYQSNKIESTPVRPDPDTVKKLIKSLDNRGAWVEEIAIDNFLDYVNKPPRKLKGISTGSYIRNMQIFLNYVK